MLNSESMYCPVCETSAVRFFQCVDKRDYWQCDDCQAIFLDHQQLLAPELEHAHYRRHHNDLEDAGYREFLSRLAKPLIVRLVIEHTGSNLNGLDYGCGPGPLLAKMMEEAGHQMAIYDPLFFDNPALLAAQYDFITCSEVVEHFHAPAREFERLNRMIKAGGLLAVMTSFPPEDDTKFPGWHYRRDPTHVVFYRPETFEWLAKRYGWDCEIPCRNVAILKKPA